jgi:hypothetical protein
MPYNKSAACVHRQSTYLDQMLLAKRTIAWPVDDPAKFARQLREAMHTARRYQEFLAYHNLKHTFRIRVYTGSVEAEYIGGPTEHVPTYSPEAMTIDEVDNVHAVVGGCIKFVAQSNELRFPNVKATDDELKALYEWGLGSSPKWQLIYNENAGVTMTRKKVDEIFLWAPEEEEVEEDED